MSDCTRIDCESTEKQLAEALVSQIRAETHLIKVLEAVQELAKRVPYCQPELDDVFRSAFAFTATLPKVKR